MCVCVNKYIFLYTGVDDSNSLYKELLAAQTLLYLLKSFVCECMCVSVQPLTSSYMKSGSELVASSSVLVRAWSANE